MPYRWCAAAHRLLNFQGFSEMFTDFRNSSNLKQVLLAVRRVQFQSSCGFEHPNTCTYVKRLAPCFETDGSTETRSISSICSNGNKSSITKSNSCHTFQQSHTPPRTQTHAYTRTSLNTSQHPTHPHTKTPTPHHTPCFLNVPPIVTQIVVAAPSSSVG